MSKQIEFYFDFGSPTAYLAYTQLKKYSQEYGAEIVYKPMLLGAVHKATKNLAPFMVPSKSQYLMRHDMPRYIRRYGVPFGLNTNFPINTLPLMRGCMAAAKLDCLEQYIDVVYTAFWVKGLNMGDLEVIKEVLTEGGLDADKILEFSGFL